MESKPFTIISFDWMKKIEARLAAAGEEFDSIEVILTKLSALAAFLDRNQLTTRRLTKADGTTDQDFVLNSTDLSPLGLQLIRKAFEKWQRQAKSPDDVKPLEKALAQLRAASASKGSARES
jgi:hypothetical protein